MEIRGLGVFVLNEKRKEVIEKLIEEIHYGNIITKGKLPSERRLAELLKENRPIVREALISLEAMGVIDIREKQGIFLSPNEENEARKLLQKTKGWPGDILSRAMEMRQIIEPSATALATARRSDENVSNLSSCLENMRNLQGDAKQEAARVGAYWNTVFHTIIVSATGNAYMIRVYESVLSMIEDGMSMMRSSTKPMDFGGRHITFREHELLFEAIKNKDKDAAERVAEEHLSHTIKAMVRLGQIVPSSALYEQEFIGRLRFEKNAQKT